ncbi:response regulator [Calothrix sp. FACHB-156]|uniref:response regulator n=1 Tax=unclassified Tolypothrix TaxID=2649714 RepID=UPI0005EAB756|nr:MULTISPECIES: response regulator [unclassified Tolypothrix]MBD2169541.1 response regulator [Calothrix membranacea FACHB-236]MBD2214441.1 response regulator [Nostoc linckia FACHB-104]MBD2340688.1 response regulator [Calothrix sp. FACHB-156]BAY89590.1 response regulator receiver protein [Microchaete diplosiphon NIES-3275]EKF02568.1 response regulator [Tolypothrix sp. PCC 7601]
MTTKLHEPLLVVEDSNEDFRMLQRLMRRMAVQNPIYRCTNGDEVLDLLYQEGNNEKSSVGIKPSVILLDLNLPGIDGRDILERLKQDTCFKEIPIVVFTTSSNPKDIELCYQKGANGYLVKPMDAQELQKTIQAFVAYWLEANTPPV